jgi:hypothetical protein
MAKVYLKTADSIRGPYDSYAEAVRAGNATGKPYVVTAKLPKRNRARRRNAGQSGSNNSPTRTRTATSTKATTTGNKTGTSTGGAVSGGGGNITVSVKRNPPKGFIHCSGVKIERLRNGGTKVRIRP